MVADKKPVVAKKAAPAAAKVVVKKAAPVATKEGDAAKKGKAPKGKVTNAFRAKNMMLPTKDAKALVKPNSVRLAKRVVRAKAPAKTAKKAKTPKDVSPEIKAKIASYAARKEHLKKKRAAMPPKEIKQQPKKVIPGCKKSLINRAAVYNKNKKNYNMTRRAVAQKSLKRPGGKLVFLKKVSKQTPRSLSNPKADLKKKVVAASVGKKDRKSVYNLARAARISHANRQASFALKDPKDKFIKKTKRSLPSTFLGKYAPAPATFRTICMKKLPEGTQSKDIFKSLVPYTNEIRRVTINMNKRSGKKATKDAEGKVVAVPTGKAFIRVKTESSLKMIMHNTRRSVKIGEKRIGLTEIKLKNKFETKKAEIFAKKTFQAHQARVAARKINKVEMHKNFLANKANFAAKLKSRRANSVPAKRLVRDAKGEVYKVIKNKARMQPKIMRKRLSGKNAFKAMARRCRQ